MPRRMYYQMLALVTTAGWFALVASQPGVYPAAYGGKFEFSQRLQLEEDAATDLPTRGCGSYVECASAIEENASARLQARLATATTATLELMLGVASDKSSEHRFQVDLIKRALDGNSKIRNTATSQAAQITTARPDVFFTVQTCAALSHNCRTRIDPWTRVHSCITSGRASCTVVIGAKGFADQEMIDAMPTSLRPFRRQMLSTSEAHGACTAGSGVVSLSGIVPSCSRMEDMQTLPCASAVHRYCSLKDKTWSGVAQELGAGSVAIACFKKKDKAVPYSEAAAKHDGCNGIFAAANADCRAAAAQLCGVGVVVEATGTHLGVACYAGAYDYVSVSKSEMERLHGECSSVLDSRTSACVSAAYRACAKRGKGAGLILEVGGGGFGVACIDATWFGEECL